MKLRMILTLLTQGLHSYMLRKDRYVVTKRRDEENQIFVEGIERKTGRILIRFKYNKKMTAQEFEEHSDAIYHFLNSYEGRLDHKDYSEHSIALSADSIDLPVDLRIVPFCRHQHYKQAWIERRCKISLSKYRKLEKKFDLFIQYWVPYQQKRKQYNEYLRSKLVIRKGKKGNVGYRLMIKLISNPFMRTPTLARKLGIKNLNLVSQHLRTAIDRLIPRSDEAGDEEQEFFTSIFLPFLMVKLDRYNQTEMRQILEKGYTVVSKDDNNDDWGFGLVLSVATLSKKLQKKL